MSLPSEVTEQRGIFDRFADAIDRFVSRSHFFALCVALVVGWLPTYLLVRNFDTYQLLINTPTTIVTFLLVSLAQNTARCSNAATQHKLNAIADALADFLDGDHPRDARELREAVGLEQRESST